MYSVICVFYCIYSDVQRSIRKGNNPKVKMVSVLFTVHRGNFCLILSLNTIGYIASILLY